jgi:hypothetical protein
MEIKGFLNSIKTARWRRFLLTAGTGANRPAQNFRQNA